MSKISAVSILLLTLLLTACGGSDEPAATDTAELTESTTEAVSEEVPIVANAETITAYGQLLNDACVYLNENYADKITGEVRIEYDATCERLHNINLQGISAVAQMSDSEREAIFARLEEIENIIFDSVAEQIGVKAELTEAVTTTADKADTEVSGELITGLPQETTTAAEPERITAAE